MLRGIHKASTNWLGKAVMALVMGMLVVSFAIWGIGDIFRGFGQTTFAKIGDTEVSIEQFRAYYTDRMSQLGRRIGRPLTPAQARSFGLDRQLLGQFVAETALDERAKKLGLAMLDDEISRRIMSDSNFAGPNGQFDRQRFELTIRQAGYTEATFIREQRQLSVRRQIALSLSGDVIAPMTVSQALFQAQNETRDIDMLKLGAAQAGDIAPPTPEALRTYFDERKALFRAPELRKATILSLTPASMAQAINVSDDDARAAYESRKAEFGTPEKRAVRQIVFPSLDEAKAAYDKIKAGQSFAAIAASRNLKDSDVDLGVVAKAGIIDPAVADAAFALKVNEVSEPVQGRFVVVLLQVTSIEPASQKPFADVSAEIKKTIAETRARDDIGALRDKIEDERAAGSTLAEAATKNNLSARTIDAIDRSARDAAGQPVADLPDATNLVNALFATDIGVESDPLQVQGGGYIWYDVTGITPSRERTFDEVKDQIEARWKDDEIAKRLKAKADELVAKVKAGATLESVAAEAGLKVEQAKGLQRGKAVGFIPEAVSAAAFRTLKGAAAESEGTTPAERVVFVVSEANVPKFDAAQSQDIVNGLKSAYGDDLINEYVARLGKDLGVTINEAAFAQISGAATN